MRAALLIVIAFLTHSTARADNPVDALSGTVQKFRERRQEKKDLRCRAMLEEHQVTQQSLELVKREIKEMEADIVRDQGEIDRCLATPGSCEQSFLMSKKARNDQAVRVISHLRHGDPGHRDPARRLGRIGLEEQAARIAANYERNECGSLRAPDPTPEPADHT